MIPQIRLNRERYPVDIIQRLDGLGLDPVLIEAPFVEGHITVRVSDDLADLLLLDLLQLLWLQQLRALVKQLAHPMFEQPGLCINGLRAAESPGSKP